MNKYEDDYELAQHVHLLARESCEEHTPDAVRKELKSIMWLLSGSILIIGAGVMLFISLLRDDISLQRTDIKSQGEKLEKVYEIASRLKITEARVDTTEAGLNDLKKKTDKHYVILSDRVTVLENKIGNN